MTETERTEGMVEEFELLFQLFLLMLAIDTSYHGMVCILCVLLEGDAGLHCLRSPRW